MPDDLQRRPKTQLACDTCRRRKSRCDGRRPTCSHCLAAGAECQYRPPPSTVAEDASVHARLLSLETRLDALEETRDGPPVSATFSPAVPAIDYVRMPEFHHGAGHKILQYWSRLRVNLTIPGVEVLEFLQQAEEEARMFEEISESTASLPLSLAIDSLRRWPQTLDQMPVSFALLLRSKSPLFSLERIAALGDAMAASAHAGDDQLRLADVSLEEMLLYAIALPWGPPSSPVRGCFARVLQHLWRAQLGPDTVVAPFLLAVAHLFLYAFAMPFHALGVLRVADPILSRLDSDCLTQVFYILQRGLITTSDLLAEVDGLPSTQLPVMGVDGDPYLEANLFLRSCLNRILGQLFTTEQAYCQPREVHSVINAISLQIEQWYRALPLELQFVRDARTFQLLMPLLSPGMKELSIRYHACLSVLNRPVLYSVLYQDLENSATTPPGALIEADHHLEPWVLALCQDCVENAKMIITILARFHQQHPSALTWCDIQLLVGSYAVLLSVQTASAFSLAFRDIAGLGEILDLADGILHSVAPTSLGYASTLEILLNIRHNFQNSTPLTGYS